MLNMCKMPNNCRDQYTGYREVRLSDGGRSGALALAIRSANRAKAKDGYAAPKEYTVLKQLGLSGAMA